tara:strand:- start:7 stop:231 length:225 start_codon:yes stop_codon:yes gene_type:complete
MVYIAIMLIGYTLALRQRNNLWTPDAIKRPDPKKDFTNKQVSMNRSEEAAIATVGPIVAQNEHMVRWYRCVRKV